MALVYLNGEFLPLEKASVSVLDRGFIFGDAVYEVIPVFNGRLFRVGQHLHRLTNSLRAVRIPDPLSHGEWQRILSRLVEQYAGRDQSLYIQVSRGVAERDHVLNGAIAPTVFAMSKPLVHEAAPQPVSAIVRADVRWEHCHIKTTSLLANVLLRKQADEAGANEAILIRDGYLTEGAASNVFIVSQGLVKTPPKGPMLLPGITRDLIMELLRANDIKYQETPIPEAELRRAEEIWLTSSTREIVPVVKLDDAIVGEGVPGSVWSRIWALYQQFKGT